MSICGRAIVVGMAGPENAVAGMRRESPGDADARGRRVFLAAVLATAVLAVVAGGLSRSPSAGAPAYALDSVLVYRLEVGLVVFAALYAVVVVVRLASHGMTPSRVGTAAVDLPQLAASVGEMQAGLGLTETTASHLFAELEDQAARLNEIEYMLSSKNAMERWSRDAPDGA